MINVTLDDLCRAVLHSDQYNIDMPSYNIDHVLGIALMKIGLAAMQSPIRIDLGNGRALIVSLEGELEFLKYKLSGGLVWRKPGGGK